MRRNTILVLAASAVLLCTAVITWGAWRRPAQQLARRPHSPTQELERMQPRRAFAARLSIPTEYRVCSPADTTELVPRERCGHSDQDSPDLGALASVEETSTDPDSLRASGLAAIIWRDEKNDQALGDAISRLERALRLSTRRAALLVDLSAAHMVRAAGEQNSQDLIAAVDYALEALELEPKNPSARFNAALAMQAFGLDEEAALRWDAYLAIDSTSPWAEEARRRKRDLITEQQKIPFPAPDALAEKVAEFARAFPQEAREYGWTRVLGDWGAATAGGDSAACAQSLLHLAGQLGGALAARRGGDSSLADAVAAIRAVRSDPAATMALAQAHRAFAIGIADFVNVQPDVAAGAFDRVVRARPSSRVLLQWTALYQAGARHYAGEKDEAERDLRALLVTVDSARHPALKGRAQMMLGSMLLRTGRATVAREPLAGAAILLSHAGETELAGGALSTLGEAAYEEGDIPGAYQSLHSAQQALRPYRRSVELYKSLHGLARSAGLDGMSRAALIILNEDLQVTGRLGTPALVMDVLQARARARSTLGDSVGAARDKDSIRALLPQLPEEDLQQGWARAVLPLTRREGVSMAEMDTAVESASQNVIWLTAALIRRADLRIQNGDLPGAIEDLETATARVHEPSLKLDDLLTRVATLEQARSRFDQLVMLYLRTGQPVEALRALERGRLSFASQRNASAGDGRLAAPAGHVALEYALIGDTLLTWTIRGDIVRNYKQPVDRDEFILIAEQVTAALQSPERAAEARAGLQRLYDWLIRPVRGSLGPPETPLVILADGEVAGVPFAALLNSRDDRYLVRDHPIRYAATLADAARQASRREPSGHALLVADPAFDLLQYPSLRPLQSARREAQSLSGLYPSNVLLEGDTATRDTFVQRLRGASVVHYAGHAVFDNSRPERSYLLLAGTGTSGRLTAEAVNALRLDGVRLVVLSACRTLPSRAGRSGGFAGFSGALLRAGAGGVVGSLWEVNDQLTEPLMTAFHKEYLDSGDPARALRKAQVSMLDSEDSRRNSPAAWAGFRYTGAERP